MAAAKGAWGERQLAELEAEDRLAIACERAPTSDPVIAKLRAAFQVHLLSPCLSLPHGFYLFQSRRGCRKHRVIKTSYS